MNPDYKSGRIFFILCVLSLIISCGPAYIKDKVDLVWPLPPDEPRIRYVDSIASSLDAGTKGGVVEALFGEPKVESFQKPYGVAVDAEGRIYVTDPGRVFVFDLTKKDLSFLGDMPGSGKLRMPIGIAVAGDGRVFVTDVAANKVFIYNRGSLVGAIGTAGELETPSGVALDEKQGLVYISDSKHHEIKVYSLNDYKKIRTIGKRGTEPGEFNFPMNLTVSQEGNLLVTDTGNFRVQIFDREGKFLKAIGKLGDKSGSFARPKGIGVDSQGHIYVVDTAFDNVQIFDQEGRLLLFFGEGGSGPGRFTLPAGLAVGRDDKIYVVDQLPGSVQIFQYLGGKGDGH